MSEDLPGPFVYTDWLEKLTEIKALVVLVRLIESFHSCMQECADQGVKLRLAPSGSVPAIPSFPIVFFSPVHVHFKHTFGGLPQVVE